MLSLPVLIGRGLDFKKSPEAGSEARAERKAAGAETKRQKDRPARSNVCGCQGAGSVRAAVKGGDAQTPPENFPAAMAKGITCTHPEHRS